MPIIYYDRSLDNQSEHNHPAMAVDKTSPCYKMVRESIDGKSVFHWTKQEAFAMINWYVENWNNYEIVDEFNGKVYDSDFKEMLKSSHYLVKEGKKLVTSPGTMADLFATVTMERKMLKANGAEDENS